MSESNQWMRSYANAKPLPEGKVKRFLLGKRLEHGTIFSAVFIKADGTLRRGTFRTGVKAGVKGTGRKGWEAKTPAEVIEQHDMLPCFDQVLAQKLAREERAKAAATSIARACGAKVDAYEPRERGGECHRFIKLHSVLRIAAKGSVLDAREEA